MRYIALKELVSEADGHRFDAAKSIMTTSLAGSDAIRCSRSSRIARALFRVARKALPSLAVSGSPASGNEAQHVERQPALAVAELDQRAVTADAAVDAGAAGQRQVLRSRACNGGELGGD